MAIRRFTSGRAFTMVEMLVLAAGLSAGAAVVGVMSAQPGNSPSTPAVTPPLSPSGGHDPDDGDEQPVDPGAGAQGGSGAARGSLLAALAKARASARQLKCATQVRGITQSFVIWASNNASSYPLPSMIDAQSQTVADVGRAKDTTSNIYSILIFNGMISPELCVCPDEHEKKIKTYTTYEYVNPVKAVVPASALWDPAFSADFSKGKGRTSYAHLQPSGEVVPAVGADGKVAKNPTGRLAMWSDTFASSEAVVGDRGPQIESVAGADGADPLVVQVKTKSDASITLRNHGDPKKWEGNIGYNDAHVDFQTTLGPSDGPSAHRYVAKEGGNRWDVIFFDEPDDAKTANTFLGIFVKAGKTPSEFRTIWD